MLINQKRCINIMKGMAIVMMVYGHTFGLAREWVYLFHMPFFFMVSGYCWNDRHAESADEVRKYYFHRARRLLLPFFAWPIAVSAMNNVLFKLHFYTSDPAFLDSVGTVPIGQELYKPLTPAKILIDCYNILFFRGPSSQLAAQVWFLYALFVVCILHCTLEYLLGRLKSRKLRTAVRLLVVAGCLVLAWAASRGVGDRAFDLRHRRLFAGYLCYITGIGVKRAQFPVPKGNGSRLALYVFASFLVLCLLGRFGSVELSRAFITNPLFLIVCLLCGWVFMFAAAQLSGNTVVGKCFENIGMYTLSILFFHFMAFKIVSYAVVFVCRMPVYMVASFPVIFSVPEAVKIVYTIVGTAVPIFIYKVYKACGKILSACFRT